MRLPRRRTRVCTVRLSPLQSLSAAPPRPGHRVRGWVVATACVVNTLAALTFITYEVYPRRAAVWCTDSRGGGSAAASRTRATRARNRLQPDVPFLIAAKGTTQLRFRLSDPRRVRLTSTGRLMTSIRMTTTAASCVLSRGQPIAIECRAGEKKG
jgi:hypothetical protein